MSKQVTLEQLSEMAPSYAPVRPRNNHQVMPIWLPTDVSSKKGTGVMKVVTRQNFMNENIYNWVSMNATIAGAVGLGLMAVVLLSVNVLLAAAAGLGAGYFYGEHQKMNFKVNKLLRNRWLLEGT